MENKLNPAEKWTEGYLAALFLLLPLLLHNGYFDVMETKTACFLLLTALWLLGLFWLSALGRGLPGGSFPPGTVCALAFCAAGILAALLGGHGPGALLAADNRYQGILIYLLYGGMAAALGRCGMGRVSLAALLLGFGLNALLGVLNFLGADPLGLLTKLVAFDRGRFLGFIGNINFFGAYMTLLTPVAAVLFCRAEKPWPRLGLGLLSALGLWGSMAARSESAVLGFGAAVVLLPFALDEGALRRSVWLPGAAVTCMLAFALLSAREFSALTELMLRPVVGIALILLGAAAYALALRSRRAYGLLLLGGLLALGLLLLLTNLRPAAVPAALEPYLVLDADFGSDRGAVWQSCLRMYEELPWWQKLLGAGSGALARWDMLHRVFPDAVVDSAHNEYLHYLLTHGALGLGAYLGWVFLALRRAFRSPSALYRALGLGAAAYAVQAAVNIAQSATTPLFFGVLALLAGGAPLDSKDAL